MKKGRIETSDLPDVFIADAAESVISTNPACGAVIARDGWSFNEVMTTKEAVYRHSHER